MSRSLVVLFAVLFVDSLDAGMIVPILPQLFTEPESPALLIPRADVDTLGMLWVALLGAAYAVPAFAAQPLLGQLADRYGRRPLLLASFVSSALSFFAFGFGVAMEWVWLLAIAKAVDGVAAGNLLVSQAAVADSTDGDARTRYFGYFAAALSLGFVVGPLLGGFLGDASAGGWRGPATAFFFSGALNTLAIGAFYFLFDETLDEGDRDTDDFALGQAFRNAREAFGDRARRPYYLAQFCYTAGYTFFMTFYAVVLEERVGMDTGTSGAFFACLGAAFMVAQFSLVDRVERWLGAAVTLRLALACAAVAVAIMAWATMPVWAFVGIVPFAVSGGLLDPLVMSLLSRSTDERQQGRIQGVRGSVAAVARAVPPFIAGPIAAAGAASWAVLVGAGVIGAGALMAFKFVGETSEGEGGETDGEVSLGEWEGDDGQRVREPSDGSEPGDGTDLTEAIAKDVPECVPHADKG